MGEWVSIKDKMPEKFDEVFVAEIINGEIYSYAAATYLGDHFFEAETSGLDAYNYDGGAHISLDMGVTHWIPLPKPPKD